MASRQSFAALRAALSIAAFAAACVALASAPADAQGPGSPGFNYGPSPQPNPYSPQGMAQGLVFQLSAIRNNFENVRQGCIREFQQSAVDFNQFHCAGGGYALDAAGLPLVDPKDDAFVEIGQCVGAVNDATGIFQSGPDVVKNACSSAQSRAGAKPNYTKANACWPQLRQAATTADRAFFDYQQSAAAGNRDRAQAATELRQASDCIKQEVMGNATLDAYMALMTKSLAGSVGGWMKALNPAQLAEFVAAAAAAGISQKLLAQLQAGANTYSAPPNPTPAPYNPPPPAPYAVPYDPSKVYPPLQQASEFSNRMRAAAESLLQAAGRISKAMTDANDVTKHNNVGLGVMFGAMLGSVGQGIQYAAKEYQLLAAAGHAVGDEAAIEQIADVAVSQSQVLTGQAEQAAAQLQAAGPAMADAANARAGADTVGHYLEGAVADLTPALAQGDLPTCTQMSCFRLSELLGKNYALWEVYTKYPVEIVFNITETVGPNGQVAKQICVTGGSNVYEVVHLVLQRLGIAAQEGSDFGVLMNEVRAGKPAIAYVQTVQVPGGIRPALVPPAPGTPTVTLPLHALVIEGTEVRNGVTGLRIYDPGGWTYWQPISTFQKYFANIYVVPQ
ncbi:MAG TPA: hypothetical protein VN728_16310 [Stellaceae bacterium]|nr:hypothetical protein [Stellaceae bacterium]